MIRNVWITHNIKYLPIYIGYRCIEMFQFNNVYSIIFYTTQEWTCDSYFIQGLRDSPTLITENMGLINKVLFNVIFRMLIFLRVSPHQPRYII